MKKIIFIFSVLLFIAPHFVYAQSKTTKYTYDSLGRLTFVEDNVNGNRDYDYDAAGNRLRVTTNTANDAVAEPTNEPVPAPNPPPVPGATLAAPSGLRVAGPLSPYGGGYDFSWSSVAGATYYIYALSNGQQFTTTRINEGTAGTARPVWVKAANVEAQSPAAYF